MKTQLCSGLLLLASSLLITSQPLFAESKNATKAANGKLPYELCGTKKGNILVRDRCRVPENTLDVASLSSLLVATAPAGEKGDQGPKGETGAQGPAGADGAQGLQGDKGDKGDKGDTGDQGPQGLKGDKGDKGDTGDQGPQGIKGDKGDKGDTGDQGPQGLKGDKGDTGDQGPQGLQGEKGDKGDTGDQGPQGDKGDKGDTGDTGPAGADGIVNIAACQSYSLNRTGSNDETQTVFCADPDNQYVQHVGFDTDNDKAWITRQNVLFEANSITYSYPVGATVRAYKETSIFNNNYTLTVTILCCPIVD